MLDHSLSSMKAARGTCQCHTSLSSSSSSQLPLSLSLSMWLVRMNKLVVVCSSENGSKNLGGLHREEEEKHVTSSMNESHSNNIHIIT